MITPRSEKSTLLKKGQKLIIEKISFGNKTIAKILDINDRTEALKIIPFDISILRENFLDIKDDEYYIVDLINLTVLDNKTNKEIGFIEKSFDNQAQIVLSINLKDGNYLDLPFIDNFFPEVNLKEGFVKVCLPEFA